MHSCIPIHAFINMVEYYIFSYNSCACFFLFLPLRIHTTSEANRRKGWEQDKKKEGGRRETWDEWMESGREGARREGGTCKAPGLGADEALRVSNVEAAADVHRGHVHVVKCVGGRAPQRNRVACSILLVA